MEYKFDFEKLDVYQLGIDFVDKAFSISGKFSWEIQYSLGDQFRRASLSIINNIAEGSGKKSKKGKIQFYGYALDSARECIPMITIALKQNQIDKETFEYLRADCVKICNMLGRLIKSVQERRTV